jgi:CBS domain-containing protein
MQVFDVMTPGPRTCAPETTIAEAADLMWQADCGVLPVVREGKICGIATDRDLFIALATRNARAAELTVGSVACEPVVTCSARDDVHQALSAMKAHRVRRLPVLDDSGAVVGIVSMNDLLLMASPNTSLTDGQVVSTLQTISEHPLPVAVPFPRAAIA